MHRLKKLETCFIGAVKKTKSSNLLAFKDTRHSHLQILAHDPLKCLISHRRHTALVQLHKSLANTSQSESSFNHSTISRREV